MSPRVIRMVEADIERPNHGPEPADFAFEGNPIESTHEYYGEDGRSVGVWECTPGRIMEEAHAEDEFVTLLSGRLGLMDNETGNEEVFVAGDSFFLPKGSSLTWVIYETVRKFYMTVG